jgi:hypothetical protein
MVMKDTAWTVMEQPIQQYTINAAGSCGMTIMGFVLMLASLTLWSPTAAYAEDPLPDESVGSREFISRAQLPGEIPINEAPFVVRMPGHYILMNDIDAEASAITVLVSNVVLDLNGHTITYANGHHQANSGCSGIRGPEEENSNRYQETSLNDHSGAATLENLILCNGRIRFGRGKGDSYAPAINIGGFLGSTISDVVIETHADDSEALIIGPKSMIAHCTINHSGNVVSKPDIGLAVVVAGKGSEIRFCRVTDAPQTIIRAAGKTEIHHNVLRSRAKVPFGYAIQGAGGENVHIHDNKILSTNGHGIYLSSGDTGWEINDNYIEVSAFPEDAYLPVEAHGIRMEKSFNALISNNQVVCYTAPGGEPAPLSLALAPGSGNIIRDNLFAALSLHPGTGCYGAYLSNSDGFGTDIAGNVFYLSADSDSSAVNVSWEGAQNHTFRNSQFRRLGNQGDLSFMRMNTGPEAGGHNQRFVDCSFQAGIAPASRRVVARNGGSYQVAYSFRLETLVGVEVEIFDKNGIPVEIGSTDDQGSFEVELDAFMVEISGRASNILKLSPYTIRIASYDVNRSIIVDPIGPMEWILDLEDQEKSLGAPVILTPTRPVAGTVDETYQIRLSASVNQMGRWQLDSGRLPAGLSLNGDVIAGTPKESGFFPITLRLETAAGEVTKSVLLTIQSRKNSYWKERIAELIEAHSQPALDVKRLVWPYKKSTPDKPISSHRTSSKVIFYKVPIY